MVPYEEGVPFASLIAEMIFEENGVRRFIRFFTQGHVGFFGRIFTFFSIAFFASRYQIVPGVGAAACTGCYVIDGQIFLGAAILAFVIVEFEYILPGKINALVRGVNISI